ncbi:MAG TPA: tyrosinase family protein [Thermoanaerobaculia bacterium]
MRIRGTVFAVIAAMLLISLPSVFAQGTCKQRRNVDKLTAPEIKAISDAIQKLKQERPDRYEFWKNVHGRSPEGPCIHGDEQIFPWHRAMLYYFEQELRTLTGNQCLALPYWDWTQSATGKEGYPEAFETAFPNITRNDNSDTTQPAVSPDEIRDLLTRPWQEFTEGLEGGPHNGIHGGYVGGDMGSPPTAGKDFIFYGHHANLDRIWAQYQLRHPGENPGNATYTTQGFPKKTSTKDVLDIALLEYSYDDLQAAPKAERAAPPSVPAYVNLSGGTATTFPIGNDGLDGESLLVLEKVPVSTISTIQGVAYLHPASVAYKADDPDFKRAYFAGYFFVWKRTAGQHSTHPATETVVINVGQRFATVAADRQKGKWVITVVTSTVPDRRPKGLLHAALKGASLQYGAALLESANKKRTLLKAKGR